jgi:ribosomal protein S18 acetylase RimI-like enzyme
MDQAYYAMMMSEVNVDTQQNFEYRLLQLSELDVYASHVYKHLNESGVNNINYTPYPVGHVHSLEKLRERTTSRITKRFDELDWQRCLVAVDQGKFVGHIEFHGYGMQTSLHRCYISLGIDREYRGKGVAFQLLNAGIQMIKEQTLIEWVDLHVFLHNEPAIKLYRRFGFQMIGSMVDRFRIDGQSIVDCQMAYKVPR